MSNQISEKSMSRPMAWSFTDLWNNSLIPIERDMVKREIIWASEVGQPFIDRFYKMNAVTPTNPPNTRSLRKFQAGNLVEWVVRFALSRAGIILDCQEEVWVEYKGLLRVKGKLDFKAGGVPDFEKAKRDVSSLHLPSSIEQSSLYIVDQLTKQYEGKPLKEIVLEIKSCSSFVANAMEKTEQPIPHHRYQAFHYIKGLDMDEAHLCYICKDDLRMFEFPIYRDETKPTQVELQYISDIKKMTYYIENNELPDKEPLIKYVHEEGKFKKNIYIEYSNYLTMVYGFESPRKYSDFVSPQVARWNRVLSRAAKGEKVTDKNREVQDEIKKAGYDFEELVWNIKELGFTDEEETE